MSIFAEGYHEGYHHEYLRTFERELLITFVYFPGFSVSRFDNLRARLIERYQPATPPGSQGPGGRVKSLEHGEADSVAEARTFFGQK